MDLFHPKLIFLLKDRPDEVKEALSLSGKCPLAS
jgi:hypothetical protein